MALNYVGQRNNSGSRNLELVLLYNSITVDVGDALEFYTNGYATNGAAATPLKGIVHAICTIDQLPILTGSNIAGSENPSATTSITTESDNTTTELYWALIDTATTSKYSAEVSGTLGTTVSSTLGGCRIDIDSSNTDYGRLLESTATRTIGTPANFYSFGADPDDSTRLIVSLAMSEEYGVQE